MLSHSSVLLTNYLTNCIASKGEIIDPDRLSQLVLLKDPIIIKMVIVLDVVSLFILEYCNFLNSKIKLTEYGDVLPSSCGMTGLQFTSLLEDTKQALTKLS